MTSDIKYFVKSCETCKAFKKCRQKYGQLPLKDVSQEITPWDVVQIDTIGPYSVTTNTGKLLSLSCKTMIDPATGWFEIKEMKDTNNSADASRIFNNEWLSRYPRPKRVVMDNGSEFKRDFKPLLQTYGIKAKHISVKNPQANAILERIHQVVGDMLRLKDLANYDLDSTDPWSEILASVAWAIRSTVHTTLEAPPGQLVFGRDMIFHNTFKANWQAIHARKARAAVKSNIRENSTRSKYTYTVGDYAYVTSTNIKRK